MEAGVRVSMKGRCRWMDDVCIERLWSAPKQECIHPPAHETGSDARAGIGMAA